MSKSSIVFFDCVTHYGGSNKSTVLLIRELQKLNPVVVLDAYGTCQEYLKDLTCQQTPYSIVNSQVKFPTVGGSSGSRRILNILKSIPEMVRTVKKLRRLIFDINPRAVWVNSEKAMFMLFRAVGNAVPVALYVRGELQHISPWAKRDWYRLNLIVGNSKKGLEYFVNKTGYPPQKVIYNGVDMKDILKRSELPISDLPTKGNSVKIVMPASLIPLKNHEMAIRGLAKYINSGREAVLWICGDVPNSDKQPEVDKILQLPKSLEISNHVHFLGWQHNIPAILRQSDVMALTSRTEGMPRAVMEAMAIGKPVLVTRVGGVPELVRDGIDGIVIAIDDVDGFADGLCRLANADLRQSMGRSGQLRIADQFSLQAQARQFFNALNTI